jgi:hypothetical protein
LRSTVSDVFAAALEALRQLSECVGDQLNPQLVPLLVPLHQKYTYKIFGTRVQEVIGVLDQQGGKEALKIIKTKIPTYCKG